MIDTWSFGCVLSICATWVVLGDQGYRAYEELRKQAVQKLRTRKAKGESVSTPKADDAFHDGVMVLPEIRQWHDHLRSILRRTDTATVLILDLIDQNMLGQKPSERSTSREVASKMESSMLKAQKTYRAQCEQQGIKEPSLRFREALLAAQQSAQRHASIPLPTPSVNTLFPPTEAGARYKSSTRVKKSAKMSRVSHINQSPSTHLMELSVRPAQNAPPLDDSTSIYPSKPLHASPERNAFELDVQTRRDSKVSLGPQQGNPGIVISQAEPNSQSTMQTILRSKELEPPTEHVTAIPRTPHPIPIPRKGEARTSVPTSSRSTAMPLTGEYTYEPLGILPEEALSANVKPSTGSLFIPATSPNTAPILPSLPNLSGIVASTNRLTATNSFRIDPLWPICEELQKLQKEKSLVPKLFGLPKDGYLEKFLKDRDIVSLVRASPTRLMQTI